MSASDIKRETQLLSQRLDPVLIEHFDGWVTVGIRAGGGCCIVMGRTPTRQMKERVENEILILASKIARRRGQK